MLHHTVLTCQISPDSPPKLRSALMINQSIISLYARNDAFTKSVIKFERQSNKSIKGINARNMIQIEKIGSFLHNKYPEQVQMEKSKLGFDPTIVPKSVILPDVSDLPAEIDYIFSFPKDYLSVKGDKYACVLTFTDDETTMKALLNHLLQNASFAIPKYKFLYFAFEGRILDNSIQVKDLKKQLLRTKLNGIYFSLEGTNTEAQYVEENAVLDYFNWNIPVQGDILKFYVKFVINLQGCLNEEVIYVYFNPFEEGRFLLKRLIEQIETQFRIQLEKPIKVAVKNPFTNMKEQFFDQQRLVSQKVYPNSTLFVDFANPNKYQLKRPLGQNNNSWIVIYKQNEKQSTRIKFDEISYMTFEELYRTRLEVKGAQRRKEAVYCLKIMDEIVKPFQKLSTVEKYFKNSDPKRDVNIIGKVVTEKMIFYRVIPNICAKKGKQFKLDELVVPEDQEQQRAHCRNIIADRAREATVDYFKNKDNVEPIVLYTSELRYIDLKTNQEHVIYQSLNKNLRDTPILSLREEEYSKEWWLRYTSTLLKHLKETEVRNVQTWRGISYIPQMTLDDAKKRKIFTYRQFTSSSIYLNTAIRFAKSAPAKEPYQLLSFKTKTGKQIIKYSLYKEGEILIEPFTEFELVNIAEEIIQKQRFKVYYLEEVLTSKQLPGVRANFVIWIDDKPQQPMAIYNKIKTPSETTIFEQLSSTVALNGWLEKNKQLFTDETAKIIFITNMTRKQGEIWNEKAGIEGAMSIRNYSATVPIFFYIGDLPKAMKKLSQSMLNINTISIGDSPKSIESFLKANLTDVI